MQEGDICRYRLVIPPKLRGNVTTERWGRKYHEKWRNTIKLLTTQGLSVNFYAEARHEGTRVNVLDADFRPCPDTFDRLSDGLHFAYSLGDTPTILPQEYVGRLLGATLSVDFFPEAQRLCVAWIKCAKRLKVHRETVKMIGRLLLSTWNDVETWYNVGVIRGKERK